MLRKLVVAASLTAILAAPALADHHMMDGGEPPMHPEIILGPPEGFMPPPDDMPPPEGMGPEEMKQMMIDRFFRFMDANGDGAVDLFEFKQWVRGAHMPPPPEGGMMGGDPMMGGGPMMGGDGMMGGPGMGGPMDGVLRAGEGDLADLPLAPECSDELREAEQMPQAENVPCGDREGNLVFRTVCNMPGFDMQAISLPDGRGAGCFGLEALRGEISFAIVAEDGTPIYDTTMGKEAFMGLKLEGPGVFHIQATGGSPDGGATIKFTDIPLD